MEKVLLLQLFHGRTDPEQDMDDWGFEGPTLGPLQYVHTTYASDVKFGFTEDTPRSTLEVVERDSHGGYSVIVGTRHGWPLVGFEGFFKLTDGMIHYGDAWYGDWSVYLGPISDVSLGR